MVPQIGCAYKSKSTGCVFCSGSGLSTSRTPEQFWEELQSLENQGFDYVSIQGEELLGDLNWFNDIYQLRPSRNLPLDITTRASKINKTTIDMLKKMNVRKIFIGVESGSQDLLNSSLKGMTKKSIENAVRLMKEYGIKTKTTFILGLPGENEKTLRETKNFARRLIELGNIETLGVGILTPLPGSPAYRMFCDKFPEFKNYDIFPIDESRKLWVNTFCDINYSELEKSMMEISSLVKFSYGFAR
jgi:radical SAM superfamily enzyme YgiQ (UPF0313 family)